MKNCIGIVVFLLIYGCDSETSVKVTWSADYDQFLTTTHLPTKEGVLKEMSFWRSKMGQDSTSITALGKLSGLYTSLFDLTANTDDLISAENLLKKAIQLSAREKDTYLRSLAHNYVTQHRFKEAKILLDSAYTYPDNKHETELILFDVNMELGKYSEAYEYLGKIKNINDYHYLIRLSKWSDHKGDLEAAIRYMEKARKVAESRGIKALKVWTYANLADYYSHDSNLKEAYLLYLMTLKLQSDHVHALTGIAKIAYSYEKNGGEANRILDSVMKFNEAADLYLMKAEIAEFMGQDSKAKSLQLTFLEVANASKNGYMYNSYLIPILAEYKPLEALMLAEKEIQARATPESYILLALALLKAGDSEKALKTMEDYVYGQSEEPLVLYYSILIYKSLGKNDKVEELKKELKNAAFELGPLKMRQLKSF